MVSSKAAVSSFDDIIVSRVPAEAEQLRKMRERPLPECSSTDIRVTKEEVMSDLRVALEEWLASQFWLFRPILRRAVRRRYPHLYAK